MRVAEQFSFRCKRPSFVRCPARIDDRATERGLYDRDQTNLHVNYDIEGSDIGHRWYSRQGQIPLFAFGYGLSHTNFTYDEVKVKGGDTLHVSFRY
jgi:beta-glucosidase